MHYLAKIFKQHFNQHYTTYDSVCEGRRLLKLPLTLLTVLLCLVIELFCLGVSN